jgi:hypothetical protein
MNTKTISRRDWLATTAMSAAAAALPRNVFFSRQKT